MKYLSPDVSVMKCPGKVLYKENIILEFTNSTGGNSELSGRQEESIISEQTV